MIENIQHDYFIWEEKNSTEQKTKLENKTVKEDCGFITEIKNDSTQKDWKDITDPKLRKKMRDKAYYLANKSKIKERSNFYYNLNKDKKLTYQKNYSKKNKQKIKTYKKHYRVVNKDKLKIKKNVYYKNNKDKIKIKKSNYYQFTKDERKKYNYNKLKTDIQYKLRSNLRSRLNRAITNGYKAGSAVRDLGCTIDEFKKYLESKFSPGMTWDNWSRDGWHIDHIKPLSSFDLKNREQLLEACHYTNLQPLWAEENLSKGKN